MPTLELEVQEDHLRRLAVAKNPVSALEELIWNALDADATFVEITFQTTDIGGIDRIFVSDNGTGITYDEAKSSFKCLGGSWKQNAKKTRSEGRILHGQLGKGRLRAFALGNSVKWSSIYKDNGQYKSLSIQGTSENLRNIFLTEAEIVKLSKTSTIVEISNLHKEFRALLRPAAIQDLSERFALYLHEYPNITIKYNGDIIETNHLISNFKEYTLDELLIDDKLIQATLSIIEWKIPKDRILYLCSPSGFVLEKTSAKTQAPGFHYTAYLRSQFLSELNEANSLSLAAMVPGLSSLITSAKDRLKAHFRERLASAAVDLITEWKTQDIYPYHGDPTNAIEEAERQVFDVLALNINSYLPKFPDSDTRSKRFTLKLIKESLEKNPLGIKNIIENVLELPKETIEELNEMLQHTSLADIINASKIVSDRLKFLAGLEVILFDFKKQLLERSQLHKILASNTWIFGEEFSLTLSDRSLSEVLNKHMKLLRRECDSVSPVLREDGSVGIVDLMLSKTIPQPKADYHVNLVIELKRPSQPIDTDVEQQITSYAIAVAEDERFRDTNTEWIFWAISNDLSDIVKRKVRQKDRPQGILFQDADQKVTIWAKTWSQILRDANARMRFFQDGLNLDITKEDGISYLQKIHQKYLPKALKNSSL
jgi:hypothetical protein